MSVPPPPPPGFGGPVLQPLPEGWTEHTAPMGQPYYFHAASSTSTYVRPVAGFPATAASPPPPPPGFEQSSLSASTSFGPAAESSNAGKKKKKKEKPIEKLPIEGTPWLKVTTNEGNVFYTNTDTKTSVWTVPEEIKELVEILKLKEKEDNDARREAEIRAEAERELKEKEAEMERLKEELEREREASRKRKLEEEEEEERRRQEEEEQNQRTKRARVTSSEGEHANGHPDEDGAGEPEEGLEDWEKDEMRVKAEIEAEIGTQSPVTIASEPALSSEEAIALFKTMLGEKGINPMRPWDMELPKFVNDPRYKAVKDLRERHDLFDDFCKHKIRENRAKKNATGQAKVDPATAYRTLLVAEVTSTRTHWEDFRKRHKKDMRFLQFGRDDREREKAFKAWLRELGEIKRADAQRAEEQFLQMLGERAISDDSKWSDVKGNFSSDPRYQGVQSSSQKEEIFRAFLAKRASSRKNIDVDPEAAKRKAQEEKKARQAASLKDREEKVRRERAALDKALGQSRAEANREEFEREYKSLLIDAVRDHKAKWNDMLATFEQDPRFTSSNLSDSHKRRMFEDHLNEVYDKRINALETLFATHAPSLQTTFDQVYSQISSNPMVTRLKMSDSRIGKIFDEWARKRFSEARRDFESLLSESSFVEYWGKLKQEAASKEEERTKEILGDEEEGDEDMNVEGTVDLKAMAAQIDLKEVEAVLKHDRRYSVFDYDPELRAGWIREHLAKLSRPKQSVHSRA